MYPRSINNLIECFKYLPGIGEKTAVRLAFSVLSLDLEKAKLFSDSILDVKYKLKKCKFCNNFSENDVCGICLDHDRLSDTLCVVDDPKVIFTIERLGSYKGLYYIIDGLISPIDGINPEDVRIDKLIDRIKNGNFREIILAVKPSIEGETTALYIKAVLDGTDIVISRIASGIPIGADMDYIDLLTLERSLNERREVS